MAIEHFIPEVWAANILENFHHQAILTCLANREYEGDLKSGDKIHIPGIVDITVKDYKTGVIPDGGSGKKPRTTAPDAIADTGVVLAINQEKSFDFYVDDIDAAQAGRGMDAYSESAANALTEDAEAFLTTLVTTTGTKLSEASVKKYGDAHKAIRSVRAALGKNKVPPMGRTLLINPSFEEVLISDESKLSQADTSGWTETLREAHIGRMLGFNVITSPFLDDTKPTAVGLYVPHLAFVSQVNKVEAMRAQDKFADRIRGLHVYGAKLLKATSAQVFVASA